MNGRSYRAPLASALGVVALLFLLLGNALTPPAGAADPLSGTYLVRYEQTEKSCGPKIRPVEARVSIEVTADRLRVSWPEGFLGIQLIDVRFDPQQGGFADRISRRVDLGPTQATLTLDVNGHVIRKDEQPEIEFKVQFDKTADDPAWNCKVAGKGLARKI